MTHVQESTQQDSPRTWGGSTLAERKATRRAALLKSAIEIVTEHGPSALTTKAVSERAGVIERYLYESFGSRDDLLLATFDACLARGSAALLQGFDEAHDAPPFERLRAAFDSALDLAAAEPGMVRFLFIDAASDAVLRTRSQTLQLTLEAVGAQFLEEMSAEPRDSIETELIAIAVVGAAMSMFIAWTTGRIDITRERLLDRAVYTVRQFVGL